MATDWDQTTKCGHGLHAIVNGIGDGDLLLWDSSARGLLVGTDAEVIDLGGKCKAAWWDVIHIGGMRDTVDALVAATGISAGGVIGAVVTAGDGGIAMAGYCGTATAGDGGIAMSGDHGTAMAGNHGSATAGYCGTATAGDGGIAMSGDHGTATVGYCGTAAAGDHGIISIAWYDGYTFRTRIAVGYIGEDGLLPDVKHRLDDNHRFVEAK